MISAFLILGAASACSQEDLDQMNSCADAASKSMDALSAKQLGRPDAASIQREADAAERKCDEAVSKNLDSKYP